MGKGEKTERLQPGGHRFDPGTLHSKKRCKSTESSGDLDEAVPDSTQWNGPGTVRLTTHCDLAVAGLVCPFGARRDQAEKMLLRLL